MAEGRIDILPELWGNATAWLPSGVTIVSSATHGGAVRAVIAGDGIDQDKNYQLVVINEPMRRIIELVESPNQGA